MKLDPTTILGLLAAFCTTTSFLPQVIKTQKTKHTKDISLPMYVFITTGMSLWLIYGILLQDLPIIIANILSITMSVWILLLKIKHG